MRAGPFMRLVALACLCTPALAWCAGFDARLTGYS